jgi:formate dehydrogenase subunit gamma
LDIERLLAQIIVRHRDTPGGLMPLLQDIQEDLGYIPRESLPAIATAMNLSIAEVHGVVSFYHDFRTEPGGRHTVQVCCAESCQAMGGWELAEHACRTLDVEFGDTTADRAITLERVYCLGNCACSPSVRVDDTLYARVDAAQFDALAQALREEELSQ